MNEKYNVYLVSDSTGETLDRIFLSLKSQFANFEYEKKEFAFIRTEQQINKIITIFTQNEDFFHPRPFELSFCKSAQLVTTVTLFSAWDKV